MINLVAEVQELKANPDRMATGTVIEAKSGQGPRSRCHHAGTERYPAYR